MLLLYISFLYDFNALLEAMTMGFPCVSTDCEGSTDVIESGGKSGGQAATIKFHHNVGGLPEELEFSLLEPLRELFKGDVRRVGLELGLPEELVWRHPFPGPGLAVRCLGAVTKEALALGAAL